MKWSLSLLCGVALVCSTICAPLNETIHEKNDIEEAQRLQTLLDAERFGSTPLPVISSSTKPESSIVQQPSHDHDFHSERLPLLSDEEFNNLGDDANPLHFLKQQKESAKSEILPPTVDHSPSKPDFVAGTPIYITIPIYINTAGQVPISLTIGEQEQRLSTNHKTRNHQTKSPNSYFNRLLQPIEPAKRRTTNRHRSQSRSKIQALKEKTSEKEKQTV